MHIPLIGGMIYRRKRNNMQIYKTTNLINGKIYIGQNRTCVPSYLGSGKLITEAILKYGRENFEKTILEECQTIEQINERERYWISYYNSTDRKIGYNISPGGETFGNGDLNMNYIELPEDLVISLYLAGKSSTEVGKEFGVSKMKVNTILEKHGIQKRSLADAAKIRKTASPETREKMKKAREGKRNPMAGKSLLDVWTEKYGEKEANKRMAEYRKSMSNSLKKSEFNRGEKHYSTVKKYDRETKKYKN